MHEKMNIIQNLKYTILKLSHPDHYLQNIVKIWKFYYEIIVQKNYSIEY